jgi:NADPH:quinone reductase-like Zn-dependent oxidoreductase
MARDLGLRHREAHLAEQAARTPLADVALRLLVRAYRGRPDGVEPQLLGQPGQLFCPHVGDCARMKAIRIHEDGGPEVLRYEDAPDPEPGPGEVLVRLRAGSLNHLDLWIRKGLPSVPKPRILGADGAGIREETGERVVINPGIEHGEKITVIGEHMDGTHAELVAVPESNVYPLPDEISFEQAAAFPLVFETAYRLLVTKAQLRDGEWVLLWGIGSGVATAGLAIAKALGARALVTSSSDEKLERARGLGADATVNHASGDVGAAVKEATGGKGVEVVLEHVGEATWQTSLQAARAGGRIAVCGATSGPNPPAALHRIWWKQLTIYGSTMGTREDFEAAYELVKSGRALPVVDSVRPLAEARAAHERMEAGEQFGKLVLTVP